MEGTVFNIQRFSIHDGPGIRTTVFLKGCSLHCFWCHNPESLSPSRQIQLFPEKCIACRRCVEVCPAHAHQIDNGRHTYRRDLCILCGRCTEECFSGALAMAGTVMKTEQVMAELQKDEIYYRNSKGGVTFSGGEPLLQRDFVRELVVASKQRGYHTAIDTAGNVPWTAFEAVLPYTDLFLFDVKALDEGKHRQATGASNRQILQNLQRLADSQVPITIRVPVIPGVNDDLVEMEAIASLLQSLQGIGLVELLPFHHLGANKYESLDKPYPSKGFTPPSAELMDRLVMTFTSKGLNAQRP